jgi:hypothetical protein
LGPGGRRFESAHPDHADTQVDRPSGVLSQAALIAYMAEDNTPGGLEDEGEAAPRQMPLGIVVARILVVSGMSFAAAAAIFFLVGGLWVLGLVSIAATAIFLGLMFVIERGAEGRAGHG